MARKLESEFQKRLKKEIAERFPGSIVLKADPNDIQGIPDLLVLYENHWAALEVKRDAHASHQANQDLYVDMMNHMSYASFIYPENKEEVLDGMARSFKKGTKRKSRYIFPKSISLDQLRRSEDDRIREIDEGEGAWFRAS